MRSTLIIIALGSSLAACTVPDVPRASMGAVHVPVVTRADYVFDAAAPGGTLAPGEAERMDAWFRSLDARYGNSVYVDGFDAGPARAQVAEVAGNYGLLVSDGAPVTAGAVAPDWVRVVVSRTEAAVPGCPDWSVPSAPNFNNGSMSNFGCSVNAALAAQIANPEDLIHGREGLGVSDARTATKPVSTYRTAPPTGAKGLQAVDTKGSK